MYDDVCIAIVRDQLWERKSKDEQYVEIQSKDGNNYIMTKYQYDQAVEYLKKEKK